MATQVYLVMYVLMFIAAVRLRRSRPDHKRGYRAPTLGLLCVHGAGSSVAALAIGFVPPSQFGRLNPVVYGVLILAGRDSRHRDRSAAPDGPAPQAGVEGSWRRASIMTDQRSWIA